MTNNYKTNFSLMNKVYFERNINQYSWNNQNFFYQINFVNQIHQNYNVQNYQTPIINYRNQFNTSFKRKKFNFKKSRHSYFNNKEENLLMKNNSYKKEERRKCSLDTDETSNSNNSLNSFSNEEDKITNKKVSDINLEKEQNDNSFTYGKSKKYEGNPKFENIEILRVNVKVAKDKIAVFRLKRYDDIFETIKLFCEINLVDEKLIKPLIIKSLSTLNTIYQIMNSKLDEERINMLQKIKVKLNKD